MKIETQSREDHQVLAEVEVDKEQFEIARKKAARKIAQRIKIPGFRPGKAPYDVVLRNAGESTINDEAIESLVDDIYPKVLDEANIKPAAPGSLEEVISMDPPKFKFLIPLSPVIDLGDYRAIRMPYDWQPPTEDKVEESIEELRRMYSTTESVTRPIQIGDFVMTDVKGMDLKEKESWKPIIEKPSNPVFIRAEEKSDEWPFSGFSQKLVGLSVDEVKTFTHKFPKDFADETLKSKSVNFEVKIKAIRGMIVPDLTDEFAKKVGSFENVAALRVAIRSNLENQSKADYDDNYFEKIIEKIKENAVIKYPPQLVTHESEHVLEDLKQRLTHQNTELNVYLKMRGLEYEKFFEEEVKPVAIRRLERSLILDQLTIDEKLEVSEENLNNAFQQTWSDLQLNEKFKKEVKNKPSKKLMESIAMESASRAMIQQTLNRLKMIAQGDAPELSNEMPEKKTPAKRKTKKAVVVKTDQTETLETNSDKS